MFSGRRCSRICECRIHRLRTYYAFVPSPYVSYYRPQTNLRKGNVFTSVCLEFCPQRGVYTPQADTPWTDPPRQTPPPSLGRHHPPWADTPRADTPWTDPPLADTPTLPGQTPPSLGRHSPGRHPPPNACWDTHTPYPVHAGIRSTRGRYASHWNAFLFENFVTSDTRLILPLVYFPVICKETEIVLCRTSGT